MESLLHWWIASLQPQARLPVRTIPFFLTARNTFITSTPDDAVAKSVGTAGSWTQGLLFTRQALSPAKPQYPFYCCLCLMLYVYICVNYVYMGRCVKWYVVSFNKKPPGNTRCCKHYTFSTRAHWLQWPAVRWSLAATVLENVSNIKSLTTSLQTICEKCGQCSDTASREQQRAAMLQRYVSLKDHANDDAQAV